MIKGIDVSAYQSETYTTSGYDFVIVKATEGRTYINPKQAAQVARARAAGLVLGFYHFLWPGNIKAQAAYFVEKCASRPGDILACDWEHTSSGPAATSAEKDAFMREVKRLRPDHRVILYCNVDFWVNRDTSSYDGDGLWIAQYNGRPGDPSIRAKWLIHQYTSSPLDINVAQFASRAAMRAWAGGTSTPPKEDDVPITDADAKKIAKAVADLDAYPVPWESDNKDNQLKNAVASMWRIVYRTEAEVKAQRATIDKLVDAVAAGPGADLEALKREIREAIEGVTVRLSVEEN
ncbi:hypothetical protein GCM10010400_40090 [Streptomyces aculeolatus]